MQILRVAQSCTLVKLAQADEMAAPLEEQVPSLAQNPYVVLDVEGVQFGSMQIGELVNLARVFGEAWKGKPHGLAIINPSEQTRTVFTTVKLDVILPMFDSLEEALKSFQDNHTLREKIAG